MTNYRFKKDFEVRSFELDGLGHVNNANYLVYLEHTRHKFLEEIGIDIHKLRAKGTTLVIFRTEID